MFYTETGASEIVEVEAIPAGPRLVQIQRRGRLKSVPRSTFHHKYHEDFEQARAWLLATLRPFRQKAKDRLDQLDKAIERVTLQQPKGK
jgi:hypothetical protein